MKRQLFIALACVSVAGCSLEGPQKPLDLDVVCDNYIGILMKNGNLCARDSAEQCEGCDDAERTTCKLYEQEGFLASDLNKCPIGFACLQTKDASTNASTNVCADSKSISIDCTENQVLCVSDNNSRCASSCGECKSDETCYSVVGKDSTEDVPQKDDCKIGEATCEGNVLIICSADKGIQKKECPHGCEQGRCTEPVDQVCTIGESRCDNDIIQECSGSAWIYKETCDYGCINATCNECTDGSMRCSGDSRQTCIAGRWAASEPCLNGCSDGECKSADIGDACDETYQQKCFNDNANALVCRNGKVAQIRCANRDCVQGSGLEVSCSESCTADSVYECAPACSADRSEGYYYSSGKVQTTKCDHNDCAVVDGYVACNDAPNCTAQTQAKSNCVPSCSDDKKAGYYMSLSGKLHTITCPNADCTKVGTYLYCGEQEACSRDMYVPTCLETNTNQGLYCSSDKIVKTFTCLKGYCKIKTDGTCEGSPRCVDNHYNIVDYPQGFVDCVEDPNAQPPANACQYGVDPMRCNGNEQQFCGSNGLYYTVKTCEDGYTCVKDSDEDFYVDCYPDSVMINCTHGSSSAICIDNDLFVCGKNNKYYRATSCGTGAYCQVNYNGYGECIPNDIPKSCTYPNDTAYCKGKRLYVCVNDGKMNPGIYQTYSICGNDTVCNVFNDGFGACVSSKLAGTCEENSPDMCENNYGYHCVAGKYQWTKTCSDNYKCQVGASTGDAYCVPKDVAGACTPGESKAYCIEDLLFVCSSDQQYKLGKVCGTGKKCMVFDNGYGECVDATFEKTCKYGESPAYCMGKQLYLCGAENAYYFKKTCPNSCIVDSNGYGECQQLHF